MHYISGQSLPNVPPSQLCWLLRNRRCRPLLPGPPLLVKPCELNQVERLSIHRMLHIKTATHLITNTVPTTILAELVIPGNRKRLHQTLIGTYSITVMICWFLITACTFAVIFKSQTFSIWLRDFKANWFYFLLWLKIFPEHSTWEEIVQN